MDGTIDLVFISPTTILIPEFRICVEVAGSQYGVRLAGRAELYATERSIAFEVVDNSPDTAHWVYDRADDRGGAAG